MWAVEFLLRDRGYMEIYAVPTNCRHALCLTVNLHNKWKRNLFVLGRSSVLTQRTKVEETQSVNGFDL